MEEKKLVLLGDEAVALGAYHSGIHCGYAYPGTPSTEITEYLIELSKEKKDFIARWSTNEKCAYEEALGVSFAGGRAIVSMKHVGLNVAFDPFVNSAIVEILGGLMVAVADDPGMHSSQNEQDSRILADFAFVPVLEPSNQQQAYDMTRDGFDLSEKFGVPVLLRLTTRVAHSRSEVKISEKREKNKLRKVSDPKTWTLLPSNARVQFKKLLQKYEELKKLSEEIKYNELNLKGKIGVLTTGIARNYFEEVKKDLKEDFSHLHIGFYPAPEEKIKKFYDYVDKIYVIEEGYPFIEKRLRGFIGLKKPVLGKLSGDIPQTGELNPDILFKLFTGKEKEELKPSIELPQRPPQLCQGCPHSDMYYALKDALKEIGFNSIVTSDIGCYTLGALPPYNAIESCVCMGASVSMAKGASDAGFHPVIAVIGDSTFMHSGITPLLDAVEDNSNMTLIILDNSGVAMTGGQPTKTSSEGLRRVLEGIGIEDGHLIFLDLHPQKIKEVKEILVREINHKGLSVIVGRRTCIEIAKKSK
ncbi:MAG: thiamine pyrophosphate-dependent enzyme [Thermoanaerobaculia bacterium]